MATHAVFKTIKDNEIEFVDLRFADMLGKQHHVTFPAHPSKSRLFEDGKMFDGSSISGWKGINESDMVLMPDSGQRGHRPVRRAPDADPAVATCSSRSRCRPTRADPRSVARRARSVPEIQRHRRQAFFGPEPEFFIFDSVRWQNDMRHAAFEIDSEEARWSRRRTSKAATSGHRPGVKGGYFPVRRSIRCSDLRSEMCKALEAARHGVEVHHHEVATAGQCEIGTRFNTLVQESRRADHDEVRDQERRASATARP